jgi:hypothetical protein
MKAKLHLTLLAVLCTMAALFITSCSDDDEADRPTTEKEAAQMIVGQWMSISDKYAKGQDAQQSSNIYDQDVWEFTADGKFSRFYHVSPKATGRYEAYRNQWVVDETYCKTRNYSLNFAPDDPTTFGIDLDRETVYLITQMTSNSFHVQYSGIEWVGGELGYKYIWEDGPTMIRVKDLVVPTDTIPNPYIWRG